MLINGNNSYSGVNGEINYLCSKNRNQNII